MISNEENRTKQCRTCKVVKFVSEFRTAGWAKRTDGTKASRQYSASCTICTREIEREQYHQNIDRFVKEWKCVLCGYDKCKAALDFHHVDPSQKDYAIRGVSMTRGRYMNMQAEINKCVLVCSNCHREIHDDIREMCRKFGWKSKDFIFHPIG